MYSGVFMLVLLFLSMVVKVVVFVGMLWVFGGVFVVGLGWYLVL